MACPAGRTHEPARRQRRSHDQRLKAPNSFSDGLTPLSGTTLPLNGIYLDAGAGLDQFGAMCWKPRSRAARRAAARAGAAAPAVTRSAALCARVTSLRVCSCCALSSGETQTKRRPLEPRHVSRSWWSPRARKRGEVSGSCRRCRPPSVASSVYSAAKEPRPFACRMQTHVGPYPAKGASDRIRLRD